MLDYDLAMLYGYEVKQFNRQVKRNGNRSPKYFMFQLTVEEIENSRCQTGTSSLYGGNRNLLFKRKSI